MRKVLLFILILVSPAALADDYYFAVKGGVSLGSYEAGYNWMLVDELKRQALKDGQQGDRLKVMSGASAGAINTILSVLEYCSIDTAIVPDRFFNNRLREGWDVDIEQLLPVKNSLEDNSNLGELERDEQLEQALKQVDGDEGSIYFKDRGSLFSRVPFVEKINRIESDVAKGRYRADCNGLSITISVTRFVPQQISLGKGEDPIKISRFVIPLVIEVDNGRLYFRNNYQTRRENSRAVANKQGIPIFHHIYLLENSDRRVPLFQLIKASLASSAFPVAFSPIELSYCNSEESCVAGVYESAFFSDGGLFDNAPIGAASEQLLQQADLDLQFDPEQVEVVYIDPANRRGDELKPAEASNIPDEKFGIAAYINYFAGAMNVGMNQELYRAKVRLMSKGIKLHTSSRRHPLAGNFHMHFSAFYSTDFRAHDYLVGLYDAAHDLARRRCHQLSNTEESCTREMLQQQLLRTLINGYAGTDAAVVNGAAFLRYLYADEFGECIAEQGAQACTTVATDTGAEVINNPYQMISLSLRKYHHQPDATVRVVEDEKVFSNFVQRLALYNQRSGGKLSKSTEAIIASSNVWLAKKGDALYKRLLHNQQLAADENYGVDLTVNSILRASEPTMDTILTHQRVGYWPLSPLPFTKLNASLYFGFDIGEYAQVFTLRAVRVPLMSRVSLEFPLTYHRMSETRAADHYFSGGPAIMYHFENYGLSSLELGYERSGKGQLYNESSQALSLTVGLLGEGIRVQLQRRDASINQSYAPAEIRSRNLIMFKIDLFKSLKTAFNVL
jgi:predicted acylesterase/phospholipase RssA